MLPDTSTAPAIAILREDWADPGIPLPAYATAGAAGADIRANLSADLRQDGVTIAPMERMVVATGLRIAIPAGFEVQVRPRSGLARDHGVTLPNTPGTIDSDYRGPLGVLLVNLSDAAFTVTHGMRIAQLVVAPVVRAGFVAVGALDDTTRGSGGFGSTGRD